jgi:hypothetical protein
MNVTLTPDGVLVDTACSSATEFGVLWPLLVFDGQSVMNTTVSGLVAATAFPPISGSPVVVQADRAAASGSVEIAYDQDNYRGPRFATFGPDGGTLEWVRINGGDGGAAAIGFRYALGGDAARSAQLKINSVAQPNPIFLSTGDWASRHQLYLPVILAPGGENTIRLEFSGPVCPNIDDIRVFPVVSATPEPDQQNFIAIKNTHEVDATDAIVRGGGYGDLQPVRVTDSKRGPIETFVYPRSAGDPSAEMVRASFVRDGQNFASVLGRVNRTQYIGRTSAGGEGRAIDLDGDGIDEVTFDKSCSFILQLCNGRVVSVEADRPVAAIITGRHVDLAPFTPTPVGTK